MLTFQNLVKAGNEARKVALERDLADLAAGVLQSGEERLVVGSIRVRLRRSS